MRAQPRGLRRGLRRQLSTRAAVLGPGGVMHPARQQAAAGLRRRALGDRRLHLRMERRAAASAAAGRASPAGRVRGGTPAVPLLIAPQQARARRIGRPALPASAPSSARISQGSTLPGTMLITSSTFALVVGKAATAATTRRRGRNSGPASGSASLLARSSVTKNGIALGDAIQVGAGAPGLLGQRHDRAGGQRLERDAGHRCRTADRRARASRDDRRRPRRCAR